MPNDHHQGGRLGNEHPARSPGARSPRAEQPGAGQPRAQPRAEQPRAGQARTAPRAGQPGAGQPRAWPQGRGWTEAERVEARRVAARRLAAAGCVAYDEEAEELAGQAEELAGQADERATLEAWLCRRERGEPLAWITGRTRFCGRTLQVASGLFVPRRQTEELARRAAAALADDGRAVDLCTGVGAVAAALRAVRPRATVVGTDLDVAAVRCARLNGVAAVACDLGQGLRSGSFDVVTAVAPYVPAGELPFLPADVLRYEPRSALDGGEDGLRVVRMVVAEAARLLRPGGTLLVELGGDQDELLGPSYRASGFALAERWVDEDGDLRGIALRAVAGAGRRAGGTCGEG